METIINNENAFKKMLSFCKKYFDKVRVVNNENSALANRSQNFYKLIVFESRGVTFSIKWNYAFCKLYFGDISLNEKSAFQYTFTKMKLDYWYPIEFQNNYNVVFWEYELTDSFNDSSNEISPFRIPVNVRS